MSTTIDERVVSMQFDNKHFEKNVNQSMSTIDKLKQKLNFKDSAKSLETISEAAEQVDVDKLGKSADEVSKKFSALEIVGITVLANLANSAVNTGKQLLKSLTVDNLAAGWNKYEQKTSSIQTIMNSTGKSIEQVNNYLDKLMWYSDETSYGFTDMTQSLAQLTAAGGDVEKLIPMIEGIANATAFAGKGAAEFSRAIYNLNQSYSAGYLQMMDWRSLELAGVASKQLKEMLISTAEELGKIEKGQISIANFSTTLKDKWADTEVMEKAFGKFAEFTEAVHEYVETHTGATAYDAIEALGDQYDKVAVEAFKAAQQAKSFTEAIDATKDAVSSGWMKTYEIIFGNIEEAKQFWGYLTDTLWEAFASGSEDRNNLLARAFNSGLTTFKDLAGALDDTGFKNHLKSVNKTFGDSIDEMIEETGSFEAALKKGLSEGTLTSDDLAKALNALTDEYGNLNETQLKNMGFTTGQIEQLKLFNDEIQNGTLSMDDFVNKMTRMSGRELLLNSDETIGELGAIPNILTAIGNLIGPIVRAFNEVFFGITETSDNLANRAEGLYQFLDGFRRFTKSLILTDEAMDKLNRTFKGIFAVVDIVLHVVKTLAGAIIGPLFEGFKFLSGGVLGATASIGDFLVALRDVIKGSTGLATFASGIGNVISSIVNVLKNFASSFYTAIHESGFSNIVDFLKSVWEIVKTIVSSIGSAIGGLFSSIGNAINGTGISTIFELISAGAITTIAIKISKLFDNVEGIIEGFTDILGTVAESVKAFTNSIKAKSLMTISKAMLMLAGSILIIALIDKDTLERSLAAITLLFVGLMGALTIIGSVKSAVVSSGTIMAIGVTLLLMAMTLKKLSSLDWSSMSVGLVAMTGTMVILMGALTLMALIEKKLSYCGNDLDKHGVKAIKGAGTIFKIGLALLPAVLVLKLLGTMDWKEMGVGLIAMTGALIALTGSYTVLALANKIGNAPVKGASQILVMALSMIPIALVMKILSTMGWEEIGKTAAVMAGGLLALTGALAILALIDRISNNINTRNNGITVILGKCLQLTLIAWALGSLAAALAVLAFVSWESIAKGLLAMGASLGILIKGLKSISEMNQGVSIASVLTLLGMVAAIKMLLPTLFVLGQYKWETIGKGLAAMLGVMTILVASMKILSSGVMSRTAKFELFGQKLGASEGTPFIRMAASLIVMAAAIKVLASSLVLLGQLKWSTILKGLTAMAGVMTILIVSSKLLGSASLGLVSLAGAVALIGVSCLAAGAGIALVAYGLAALGDSLGAALVSLCTAIYESAPMIGKAIASLVVELLKALVSISDQLVRTLADLLLNAIKAMSEYLPSFIGAIVELVIGIIDEVINELPKLAEPITKLMNGLFGLFDQVMENVDTSGMKNIAAAVGILSLAMLALSKISWAAIPKAIVGVGGMVIVLGLLATLAGGLAKWFPGLEDTMNAGAGVLGALGNAIGSFIGGLLGGISAAFSGAAASNIDNVSKMLQTICSPEIITSLLLVAGLTAVITALAKMKVDPMDFSTAIGNFSKVFLFIAVIVTLFGALSEINGFAELLQNGANILKSVCSPEVTTSLAMVAGLAAIISLLAKLKINPGDFGKATLNLLMAFGLVAVLAGAFAGIAAIPDAQTAFTNGVNILKTICAPDVILAIGMVGVLAAEVSGLAFMLSKLKLNLSDVGKAILTMAGVVAFVSAIVGLFGLLALIPGAADFLKTGVEMLELVCGPRVTLCLGLAAALMAVCAGLSFIAGPAIIGAGVLLLFIAAVGAFIALAGYLATSPGMKIFEDGIALLELIFSTRMLAVIGMTAAVASLCIPLGVLAAAATIALIGVAAFITALGGIIAGLGALYQSKTVQKLIEDGGNALEAIGKAIGKFIGGIVAGIGEAASSSLATIGSNLAAFMTNSAPFFDGLSKFDGDMEERVKKLASIIETIVTEIPRLGGLSSVLFGEVNPETFGKGLTELGNNICEFASSMSTNADTIETGIESFKKLIEAIQTIPKSGGFFEKLFGGDDFENFVNNVKQIGNGIAEFASAIKEVDVDKVYTGIEAGKKIFGFVNQIANNKEFDKIKTSGIKRKFEDLGDAIKKFAEKTKGVNSSSVKAAVDAINTLTTSLKEFSTKSIDSIVKAFDNSHSKIADAITRVMTAGLKAIGTNEELLRWYEAGKDLMDEFADGIEDGSDSVETETENVLDNASSVDSAPYKNRFVAMGSYLISGLETGIKNKASGALATIRSVCASVTEAARSVFRINSPSKEFYDIGSYCGQGLVNSLKDYASNTYDAGYDMGNSSIKGLGNAMKKVESIIGDGIETQPTIKPVLDLSDVTSGVGTLNKMFDTNPSIGAVSTVNSINRLMNRQNDASNDDVISAINGLKDTIADSSGPTYNFGNVSYDTGTEVQEAVEKLVKAIIVGGRK